MTSARLVSPGRPDARARSSRVFMTHLRLLRRCRQPAGHQPAERGEHVVTGLGRQFPPQPVQADTASLAGCGRGGTARSVSLRMAVAPWPVAGVVGPTGPAPATPPRPLWGDRADGYKLILEVQSAWQTSTCHRLRYKVASASAGYRSPSSKVVTSVTARTRKPGRSVRYRNSRNTNS